MQTNTPLDFTITNSCLNWSIMKKIIYLILILTISCTNQEKNKNSLEHNFGEFGDSMETIRKNLEAVVAVLAVISRVLPSLVSYSCGATRVLKPGRRREPRFA